jgi:hypothetical protein
MSYGLPKFTKRPAHDQGEGGRTAAPQYADNIGYTSCATISGNADLTLLRPNSSKSLPRVSSDF